MSLKYCRWNVAMVMPQYYSNPWFLAIYLEGWAKRMFNVHTSRRYFYLKLMQIFQAEKMRMTCRNSQTIKYSEIQEICSVYFCLSTRCSEFSGISWSVILQKRAEFETYSWLLVNFCNNSLFAKFSILEFYYHSPLNMQTWKSLVSECFAM